MREFFLGVIVFFGTMGLLMGGGALIIMGGSEMSAEADRYAVQFGNPGDDCNWRAPLHIDIKDGARTYCGRRGAAPPPWRQSVDTTTFKGFKGFTDGQRKEVLTLSSQLGSDGLSETEQQQIQNRVDEIAATVSVPPVNEFPGVPGPPGLGRILLGVLAWVILGIPYLIRHWRERRWRRWSY
ncbi:hypothetical protein EDD27_6016 [Nonomuraea polychroma]|uniref:Uncharacterized protein n=1 Tax=Nonomuraea polychroma TaxID=46176 RepID=A0A438MCM5_9ACTN|nr:hypothetical protein [Nonomuraea polychroma]RVX43335.1 hypothetical protein EDD27_6016 [Nonomuraea polychroma]